MGLTENAREARAEVKAANRAIGRRGTLLILMGVIWIFNGVATAVIPPPSDGSYLLTHFAVTRAVVWCVTGTMAIFMASRPQGRDALGWLALYVMAAYRAIAYATSFADWIFELPGEIDGDGSPRAIVGALVWLAIIIVIKVVAGWAEGEDTSPVARYAGDNEKR